MVLVTGGAYQGKTAYAKEHYNDKMIQDYQNIIKKLMQEGKDPIAYTESLIRHAPDAVIILREVGCGIIPISEENRKWREMVGKCGCMIAENADTVIRLCCGIPEIIKGELP